MASRYAIKVAEMKVLADALIGQIYSLNQQAESMVEQNRESVMPVVVPEALGRLDVIEPLREIRRLERETQALVQTVNRRAEGELLRSRQSWNHTTLEAAVDRLLVGNVHDLTSTLWEEVNQVCRERSLPPLHFQPWQLPGGRDCLINDFKACKNVAEIQAIIRRHQQAAVAHLRPWFEHSTSSTSNNQSASTGA